MGVEGQISEAERGMGLFSICFHGLQKSQQYISDLQQFRFMFQMKKYFLKGKEYLTKKLQELDFETEGIDYVGQQIPNRLKDPLSTLMTDQIDLQPASHYDSYFRNYPTHHLSQYLLEKFQMQIAAKSNPVQYQLPQGEGTFVPKFDGQLQRRALLLKQVIDDYDQGHTKLEQTVICMCVVHFHHKRGTEVQYMYPNSKTAKDLQNNIVHHAMPDSSHNKHEDYNFFNFEAVVDNKKTMLFGVSYFKQIKVTEEMRKGNKELTRSYTQKAVAIISVVPLFGYLKFRLAVTTKLFFDDFTNFEMIDAAYKDISNHLNQTWPTMPMNQLYIGSDLKVIIDLFGVQPFYQIWKAVLYQRRVVVFAHSSSSASSFILSLLSLFPGLSTFGMFSKPITRYMQALREYALPLRIFSSDNFMSMSFHIQDFHLLSKFQKTNDGHFLLGTTNRLLKEANDYGIELLVNLENCTIQKRKSRIGWESVSKKEKAFLVQLDQIINTDKSMVHGSSEDCIRNLFHNFLKQRLIEIIQAISLFKTFMKDCKQYAKSHKTTQNPTKINKKSSYELMEDEDGDAPETPPQNVNNDFPPLIPREVTNIPLPLLLQQKSFTHFLQFYNRDLPKIHHKKPEFTEVQTTEQKNETFLRIENNDYVLQNLVQGMFVMYNIAERRLCFGKGNQQRFEGKQIRFKNIHSNSNSKMVSLQDPVPIAKSVFLGLIENNKYSKGGFFVDENEVYEGDYYLGMKQGYGKLTNAVHKYIGYFEHNLYSGDGQLVTGSNVYVGEFKQGLKHGCGKHQGPDLNYDGEWQNDYPHGHGVLVVSAPPEQPSQQAKQQKQQQGTENQAITSLMPRSGCQYIGNFRKGKLDQQGEVTIRYTNGAMYKGQVMNMLPDGKGFLVDQHGKMRIGVFKEGILYETHEIKPNQPELSSKSQQESLPKTEQQSQTATNQGQSKSSQPQQLSSPKEQKNYKKESVQQNVVDDKQAQTQAKDDKQNNKAQGSPRQQS